MRKDTDNLSSLAGHGQRDGDGDSTKLRAMNSACFRLIGEWPVPQFSCAPIPQCSSGLAGYFALPQLYLQDKGGKRGEKLANEDPPICWHAPLC